MEIESLTAEATAMQRLKTIKIFMTSVFEKWKKIQTSLKNTREKLEN